MKYSDLHPSTKTAIVKMIASGEHQDEVALYFGISRWMVRRVLMENRAGQAAATERQVLEYLNQMSGAQRLKLFMSVSAHASFG
jgi:hypothetical protein